MTFDEAMDGLEGMVLNVSEIYFEAWFEDQDFYKNMRFIYGDKLFDKDGGAYRVLPVQMTYQAWMVGQKGIQEMDVAIKLQDADLRKYEKQISGLQNRIDKALIACHESGVLGVFLAVKVEDALRGES
ncbi:hypothetical protein [Acinetobacter variabilis]|uniref:hypothetical protein n=1 Tax=Acinetobacter variabilis TaxID=70346 RepID=UPI00254EA6E8|nr:hypothetical protein [Acinetobacter variabilis]